MAAHLRSLGSGRPESPLTPGTGPAPGGLAGEGGCLCLATVLATAAAKLTSAIYLLSPLKGQNHFLGALAFTADITDGLLPGARLHFRLPPPLNQPVRACGRTEQVIRNIPPIGSQVLGCGRSQTRGGASGPVSARSFRRNRPGSAAGSAAACGLAAQLRCRNYVCVLQACGAGIGSWPMIDEVTAPRRLRFNDCFRHTLLYLVCF